LLTPPPASKVGQVSSPDIIMTDGDVRPADRGELLLIPTLKRGGIGVCNEFIHIRKVIRFCNAKHNLINNLDKNTCFQAVYILMF